MVFGLSMKMVCLVSFKIGPIRMLHTFHSKADDVLCKGWLFRTKTFCMMFGLSIERVLFVGFEVGPIKMFYTFPSEANVIFCKGVALKCKDFMYGA